MILSARMQLLMNMTDEEISECEDAFRKGAYTHIPNLSGKWQIATINRKFSGCKELSWEVDLDLFAKSLE